MEPLCTKHKKRIPNLFLILMALSLLIGCAKEVETVKLAGNLSSLARIDDLPAGSTCPNGGTMLSTGLDTNGNKILDLSEILDTTEVCNGATGGNGNNGKDGQDGENGDDGEDGTDGTDVEGLDAPKIAVLRGNTAIASDGSAGSLNYFGGSGMAFQGAVESMALTEEATPRLLVGGAFSKYNGIDRPAPIIINTSGSFSGLIPSKIGGTRTITSSFASFVPELTKDLFLSSLYPNVSATNYQVEKLSGTTLADSLVTGKGRIIIDAVHDRTTNPDGTNKDPGTTNLFVAGAESDRSLKRVRSTDGSVAPFFNTGAGFTGGAIRSIAALRSVGATRYQSIYVCGNFTHYQSVPVGKLVRLNSNGTLDAAYNTNFMTDPTLQNINCGQVAVARDNTNHALVVTTDNKLYRVLRNGKIHATFRAPPWFSPTRKPTTGIAADPSGDFFLAVQFPPAANTTLVRPFILRLSSLGGIKSTREVVTLKIKNNGPGSLIIYSAGIVGAQAAGFRIIDLPVDPIASGASAEVKVRLETVSQLQQQATLVIATNDPVTPIYKVKLDSDP